VKEKINKRKLKKMIRSDFTKLSVEEIKRLIDRELSKGVDEIDTDYIDLCFKLMEMKSTSDEKENDIATQRKKFLNPQRACLVAGVLIIICLSVGVTDYAKSKDIKITDAIVKFFADYANIDYQNKEITEGESTSEPTVEIDSKLYQEIKDYGIDNIMIPLDLYDMEYEIRCEEDFTEKFVSVTFEQERIVLVIEEYTDEKWVQNPDIQGDFTASKKIEVNGRDVYLFELNGDESEKTSTSISYQIGLTQYFISCPYDIEKTENFIKNVN
jgi:hypothetical protein